MTELEQGVWCAAFALAFREGESDPDGFQLWVNTDICSAAADRAVEGLRRLDK